MKYNITVVDKPGMVQHWEQLELPVDAVPLHTEIWKNKCEDYCKVHDIGEIFNEDDYKYNQETGEGIKSKKDGSGLEEFRIFTRIYCLVQIPESEKDRQARTAETGSKIAKMIEEIKRRKVAALMGNKDAL